MNWEPKIKRGSTYRASLTLADEDGEPVNFTEGQFVISPGSVADIALTQVNGKLVHYSTFVYRDIWAVATAYVLNDVVRYLDAVTGEYELWKAKRSNTGKIPVEGLDWTLFAQFEIIISAAETATYLFNEATWRLHVVYTNGDIDKSVISGLLRVGS